MGKMKWGQEGTESVEKREESREEGEVGRSSVRAGWKWWSGKEFVAEEKRRVTASREYCG
jgi:hypothetical protein